MHRLAEFQGLVFLINTIFEVGASRGTSVRFPSSGEMAYNTVRHTYPVDEGESIASPESCTSTLREPTSLTGSPPAHNAIEQT